MNPKPLTSKDKRALLKPHVKRIAQSTLYLKYCNLVIDGRICAVFDNGGESADRYTILDIDGSYSACSNYPFQGIGIYVAGHAGEFYPPHDRYYVETITFRHLGKRLKQSDIDAGYLNEDVTTFIKQVTDWQVTPDSKESFHVKAIDLDISRTNLKEFSCNTLDCLIEVLKGRIAAARLISIGKLVLKSDTGRKLTKEEDARFLLEIEQAVQAKLSSINTHN